MRGGQEAGFQLALWLAQVEKERDRAELCWPRSVHTLPVAVASHGVPNPAVYVHHEGSMEIC